MMMLINDNKVHLVYGAKGAGKTTFSAFIVKKCAKRKINVYSNTPIKGAYKITIDDLREHYIEAGGVVIIDEAAAEINCRDWRQTGTEFLRTIQMARHMELTVYFISQSVTALDVQVTDLCDDAFYITKSLFNFSIITKAFKLQDRRGRPYFKCSRSIFDLKVLNRKKYYNMFDTHYITEQLKKRDVLKREEW